MIGPAPDQWARTYVLTEDLIPVPCFDTIEWAMFMRDHMHLQQVAETFHDECRISTVFLWVDHNWRAAGDPVLYETMVFCDGDGNGLMERYSTRAEALAGHERIASMVARDFADAGRVSTDALRSILHGSAA